LDRPDPQKKMKRLRKSLQASCRVEVTGNCWAGEFARAPSKKAGAHSDAESITIKRVHRGRVAQLGEHLLCKQGVAGSIPATSTNHISMKYSRSVPRIPPAIQAGGREYAYRADRSALDAVKHVHKLLNTGHGQIVDADLSGYFDSIPHSDLLKSVARRIVDGAMLQLIKMWLEAPVEETDEKGNKHRSTRNRDEGKGSPQGAPISPLLSNLYMRRFVLGWKKLGHEQRFAAYIVNYADDLVICCRGRAEEALARMRDIMTKLKLTVNETKTRVCRLPEEKFDFLGYTFGRCYSPKTGRAYIGTVPSKKRVIRVCEAISETTGRDQTLLDQEIVVAKLNRTMIGWANYFYLEAVSKDYRAVDSHAGNRLRQWLCAKHKVRGQGTHRFPKTLLHEVLGLVRLTKRTSSLPGATS